MSTNGSTQKLSSLKNLRSNNTTKILLVDHHPGSRQFNLSLLQQAGYIVDLADNSEHVASKLAQGDIYDIIFLDLAFFDKTALEIVRSIDRTVTSKNKLLILTSDNLSHVITLDFHELGLDVARRPLSMAHIAETLEQEDIELQ
jgi:DNA-binding response OmpR family regulator